MLNNLEEVRKRIEIIKNLIPGFETEERKEIKKNNKLIEELKKELTIYKDLIFNELIEKKEKSLPKDEPIEIKENEDKLNKLLENINLLSNKDYLSKLDFNKNIYDIENSGNLNIINETLKEILNKFKLINVLLTKEDFKYSVTLYKYMSCYFENIEKNDFDIIMKDIFDSLYWENPNLILHLSLNLRDLVSKYKKQFESYIKNITSDKELEDEINKYNSLKIENDILNYTNKYLSYNKFLTKELIIDDYLSESTVKKENISKFIEFDKYLNYNQEEKDNFYKDIRGLNNSIIEYMYLEEFDFLIKKIKDVYKNKDSYKNNLSQLDKKIKTLVNGKKKIDRKLFSIYFKLQNNNKSNRLNNKYNALFNKSNSKIDEIINEYKEYNKTLFENDIITKLNDNYTYYDALELYSNNYPYLMEILKENNKDMLLYNKFINYLNSPYLIISKSVLFINEIDIKEKLEEKYRLFNINFDLEENNINSLKQSLEYLTKLSYYEESELDLNKIKLILEINKLNN